MFLKYLVPSRLLSAGLLAVATLFTAQTASAQLLRSEDRWASISTGGFTIYNNVWGSGSGPQQLWVYAYDNWGVKTYQTGGGIKSYPNVSKNINKKLSAITKLQGVFNAVTPSSGAWAVTYDIWNNTKSEEVMLWFNYTGTATGGGNVKPISASWDASGNARPVATNVSVGGHTWNVYRGKNGSINVTSLLRTSKTNSGTVDIRAILNWIKSKGWFGDITVGDVQHGFEITSAGSSSTNRAEFKFSYYRLNQ